MWVQVIAVALAAAPLPRVALIPVVRPALVNAASATRIEAAVRAVLEKNVAVLSAAETHAALKDHDPVRCEGNRACFALMARVAGAWAAVRVEAVEASGAVTIAVQAIDVASNGDELAEDHFTVGSDAVEAAVATRLAPLAARLKLREPSPPPSDAPVAEAPPPLLAPQKTPAPAVAPVLAQDHRPRRGPAATIATGAGAVALAGAAAGFFAMGLDANACLHGAPIDGAPTVCVPQSQARTKQTQADAGLVLGSVASALATGLAITAVILWVTD